ncbi:MAG TPA: hypothetical protein VND54_08065 [Candidatus Saccharimonadales bacterium]|nr:hypothetical protein [Candidatus Saccharimonadales bacterium]
MTVIAWIGGGLGLLIVLSTLMSVVTSLVLPRLGSSRVQNYAGRGMIKLFSRISHRFETYEARDRFLALQAPLYLIVILAIWLAALLIGFALLLWPFMRTGGLVHAITVSGSSLFTLGFAAESGVAPRLLVFCAAAAGLWIVALQIAYLPVLYGAFNRREVLVTMLDSRAGSPAWGPELLARSELVDNVQNLGRLYQRWEEWAADVAETHASYPVLLWFRSPHPYRSWVIGLLAVMDAAAMHLATQPLLAPSEARAFLRMGYMCLRDLATVVGLAFDPDPKPSDPIQLTEDNYQDAIHHLEHVGWTMQRGAAESWVHFRGWRVNYEALAYGIADAVNAPPALWAGPRRNLPPRLQPPERPPHREPSPEMQRIRKLTEKRRSTREP